MKIKAMNADLTPTRGLFPNLDVGLKPDTRMVFQLKQRVHQQGDAKVMFNTQRDNRVDHQNAGLSSFVLQLKLESE